MYRKKTRKKTKPNIKNINDHCFCLVTLQWTLFFLSAFSNCFCCTSGMPILVLFWTYYVKIKWRNRKDKTLNFWYRLSYLISTRIFVFLMEDSYFLSQYFVCFPEHYKLILRQIFFLWKSIKMIFLKISHQDKYLCGRSKRLFFVV